MAFVLRSTSAAESTRLWFSDGTLRSHRIILGEISHSGRSTDGMCNLESRHQEEGPPTRMLRLGHTHRQQTPRKRTHVGLELGHHSLRRLSLDQGVVLVLACLSPDTGGQRER